MSAGQRQDEKGRAQWRSRRGMLEVEIELLPFARDHFDGLATADKVAFTRLLEEDDWTIHDWLRGVAQPVDAALRRIVKRIRDARSRPLAEAPDQRGPQRCVR